MDIFGAELSYGVGTPGLSESLHYFQARHRDLAFPLVTIPELLPEPNPQAHLKNLRSVAEVNQAIAEFSRKLIDADRVPFFIGGDHSCAIGTIAGSVSRNEAEGLIWIDAHPDIHVPATTVSGNIHGMPVALSLGHGEESLLEIFHGHFLLPEHVLMLGLRDIDPPEQEHLETWGVKYYSWREIEQRGLQEVLDEAIAALASKGVNGVHVSVDMDSLDPQLIPAVSVPVGGGFTPAEVETILRCVFATFPVRAMDIVEYNYLLDKDNISERWLYKMIRELQTWEVKK